MKLAQKLPDLIPPEMLEKELPENAGLLFMVIPGESTPENEAEDVGSVSSFANDLHLAAAARQMTQMIGRANMSIYQQNPRDILSLRIVTQSEAADHLLHDMQRTMLHALSMEKKMATEPAPPPIPPEQEETDNGTAPDQAG